MSGERLDAIYDALADDAEEEDVDSKLDAFTHVTCPSLAHLVAMLSLPGVEWLPEGTHLVVFDAPSALVFQAFPREPKGPRETEGEVTPKPKAKPQGKL